MEKEPSSKPYVSVVIPCRNEERFIGKVLEKLVPQYDRERYEIIVADGISTDKTRRVVSEFSELNPEVSVRLVDNRARTIPAGLNTAIRQARGEIIVRLDSHSYPSPNYIRHCVGVLEEMGVEVVGGPIKVRPASDTPMGRAIARAVAHPFGIGDAKYRSRPSSGQFVDTVAFCAFRKSLWKEVGGFNESLLTNEDYDFFYRIRRQGGRIYLDPGAHCVYFARDSLGELGRQYFRYGIWKARMVKLNPRSIRWRQIVPPAFVAILVLSAVFSPFLPAARWLFLLAAAAYALAAFLFALSIKARTVDNLSPLFLLGSFLTIHISWGSGFLAGLWPDGGDRGEH